MKLIIHHNSIKELDHEKTKYMILFAYPFFWKQLNSRSVIGDMEDVRWCFVSHFRKDEGNKMYAPIIMGTRQLTPSLKKAMQALSKKKFKDLKNDIYSTMKRGIICGKIELPQKLAKQRSQEELFNYGLLNNGLKL